MRLNIFCATLDKEGDGPKIISSQFPSAEIENKGIMPSAILGGPASLKSEMKRYEGAAPYGGPSPAYLWVIRLPMSDGNISSSHVYKICEENQHKFIDMEVTISETPENEITFDDGSVRDF